MNFEEAGRAIDRELAKLVELMERKVKPATRAEMAGLLRKAGERLLKLAESMEKSEN